MLKKLLKYDLKYIFKYWWIAALSTFVLSFIGSGCISIFRAERQLPAVIYVLAIMPIILIILSFSVFSILAVIMVFVRFYKNFFTDEGYLTFTLPVKRSQLLNSKLIMGSVTMIATIVMIVINVIVMLSLGFADKVFTKEFLKDFFEFFGDVFEHIGFYTVIYVVEAVALLVLSILFSSLFLYSCITLASIIAKKAKVITAIGIYYGANAIISGVTQTFYMFGVTSLFNRFAEMPASTVKPIIALILLGIILFFAVFCAMLYTLQYWMIDRKLNLS